MSSQKGGAYNPNSKFYRFGGSSSSSSSSSSSTMDLIAKLDAKLGVKATREDLAPYIRKKADVGIPIKKKIKIQREPKGVKATVKDIPLYSATMRTQNIGSITIPTTVQNVNPAQVGVFSAKSIPSKSSSNGGGGGSGGSGGGGGGGGRGFGGGGDKKPKPPSKPKEQRKKQTEAQKSFSGAKVERKSGMVRAKVRAPQKTLGAVKRSSTTKQKPKRDITKITTPKPKGKVQSASGTIQKNVGGGKVRATEQTRPQAKSRIQGETTTTYGRKSRMRGERTTIR